MVSRILLVDDSPTVRTIVKVYLTGFDVEFVEAGDGHEALAALKKAPVHLVIADINMPGMDGLTFLEAVRGGADAHKTLPVILLTGEKSEESRARGLRAGANALVRKPVSTTELREAVERVLRAA